MRSPFIHPAPLGVNVSNNKFGLSYTNSSWPPTKDSDTPCLTVVHDGNRALMQAREGPEHVN